MNHQTDTSNSLVSKVFVGGLPQTWQSGHLAQFMSNFGRVVNVELKRDESGNSKGFGFVYLEDHLPLEQIYGRHDYYNASIEVKELKQKFIFVDLANNYKYLSEALLVQSFASQGHDVELVEAIRLHKYPSTVVKVVFYHESSARYYLSRKLVEIDGQQYAVTASTEPFRVKFEHQNQGKHGSHKASKHDHYQTSNEVEDGRGNHKEKHKGKSHKETSHNERYKTNGNKEKQGESESSKNITSKGEEENHRVHKPKIEPSLDDQQHLQELDHPKSPRKLSYKGKDIDFHPRGPANLATDPVLPEMDLSKKTSSVTAALSPNTSKKEVTPLQSRLSPASLDWNLEGQSFVNWSEAALASNMLYQGFSPIFQSSSIANYAKGSPLRPGVGDSHQEHPKKREVWIEFYTFPGCA